VAEDLRRIEAHVRAGVDRSRVRGLAFFACSAEGLWQLMELPVRINSQVVINHSPYVRQLESVLDEYPTVGVLLADRQRARIFVIEQGELVERSQLFDELPRDYDNDRGAGYRDRLDNHVDELALQHLRRAARATFDMLQAHSFEHLIVGAPSEMHRELEDLLHPYLRERLVGHLTVPVGASEDQIRTAALEVEADVERRGEAALVARLRDGAGQRRRAVTGLVPTLEALVQRRVDHLIVSDGYVEPGWRCRACRYLGRVGRRCPVCDAEMAEVNDVVGEAVDEALTQSCRVEICVDNADLDVLGRIGALLRF
jgi:peptide subunit release factor 1 (eRF1)